MNEQETISELTVRESLKRFQTQQCPVAFNTLLNKYYKNSCKYASKFLNNNTYSNMVSWFFEEVESYVFIAFWKAAKNYRLDGEGTLSFKNYLYQLIRFESLNEMKHNFNWQCIPKAEQKWVKEEEKLPEKDASVVYREMEFKSKVSIISDFLATKNPFYAIIWDLKMKEVKNPEICKELGISKGELKSRWQYIKRLVIDKYPSLDLIF